MLVTSRETRGWVVPKARQMVEWHQERQANLGVMTNARFFGVGRTLAQAAIRLVEFSPLRAS
jgi:hypothetical protein